MADLPANRYVPTYEERVAIDFLRQHGFAVVRQRTYDRLRDRIRAFEYGRKEPMTKAEKARRAAQRHRERHEQLLADPTVAEHGASTTYVNWGCRCEPCREAWRAYCQEYQVRRKKSSNA